MPEVAPMIMMFFFVHIRLLLQLAFALKIFCESLPLHGILLDVGLRALVVDELCWIAVVQVVAWIALVLANRGIVQYKVIEDATVYIGNKTADLEQDVLAKAELQPLFMIVLLQLHVKLLALLLEADFTGTNVEPLDVVFSEKGVDGGSLTSCLAALFAGVEPNLLLGTNSKGLILFTIIAAARGEGESSKHHKCDSPELHCFHIRFLYFFI